MSGRRRGRARRLSADERAVWESIARQVTPLDRRRAPDAAEETPADEPGAGPAERARGAGTSRPPAQPIQPSAPRPPVVPRRAQPGLRGSVSFELHDPAPVPVGRPEAGLDRRTAERLRRGERAPDARIDLHGMTAERAHRALDGFIAQAVAAGLRCVLVITGKGGRQSAAADRGFMRADRGVLRQDAPRWLRSGPAAAQIIGIYEAHRRHGGAGAFYVYLKKRR
jgi:DNA-nicking Smr family endonuclease